MPRKAQTASLRQPVHILVFDNSYSMNRPLSNKSLLQLAKEDAYRFLNGVPEGQTVSIVQMSGERGPSILANQRRPNDAKKVIQELGSSHVIADLERTLPLVQEILRQVENRQDTSPIITVRVYSDFATNTWQYARSESFAKQMKSLSAKWKMVPLEKLANLESTTNRTPTADAVGVAIATYPNLGIRDLRLSSVPPMGESTEIEVVVEDYGRMDHDGSTLQVLVQGRTFASREIQFDQDHLASIRIPWTPNRVDSFLIEARLDPDDLLDDNQRFLVAPIRSMTRALILEGEPGDAKYIESALATSDRQRRPFDFTVSTLPKLQDSDLTNRDLIFLCDIKLNDATKARWIQQTVRQGGQLIAWLGPNVDPNTYHQTWRDSNEHELLLPFQLNEVESIRDQSINPLGYQSRLVLPFRDHPESGLLTTPIDRFWKVQIDQNPAIVTHLATTSLQPLIITAPFGQGATIWWTTGLRPISDTTPAWNAMAAWPSFVPILQEMVKYSGGHQLDQRNVLVGQAFRGTSPFQRQPYDLIVNSPAGSMETLRNSPVMNDSDSTWTYDQTDRIGFYQVTSLPKGIEQSFAVNTDPSESRQEYLDLDELSSWSPKEEQEVYASSSEVPDKKNYEQWVIAAALLLVMVESGMAAWMGMQRR